eukprot:maker-scaffold_2-snap-gene-17.54-mRNA-1 protein AED:0.56 eAED:0.59 QI:0/0/0/0.5/1/1/2/0/249
MSTQIQRMLNIQSIGIFHVILSNQYLTNEDISKRILYYTEDLSNYFSENVGLIDEFYKLCFDDQDYWSNLSYFYSLGETKNSDSKLFHKKETSYAQTIDNFSYSIQLLEELFQIQFMDLLNGDKLILEYQGGNQYLLAGTPLTIFLEPPCSKLIVSSVFDILYPNNGSKDYIFNLVVMDPPWPVGSSSHTRGVKLDYPLLSLSQISKIKLPIRHFPYGTFLFIRVTNTSYLTTLRWAYKLDFYLIDDIT